MQIRCRGTDAVIGCGVTVTFVNTCALAARCVRPANTLDFLPTRGASRSMMTRWSGGQGRRVMIERGVRCGTESE